MILNGSLGAFHFTRNLAIRSDTVWACAGIADRTSERAIAERVFVFCSVFIGHLPISRRFPLCGQPRRKFILRSYDNWPAQETASSGRRMSRELRPSGLGRLLV